MSVEAWLRSLGVEQHAEAFAENGIDKALLPELTNEDLKDLGVARLADRKVILKAIASLSEGEVRGETQPSQSKSSEGERRQVTVLFADLSGFTQLSNELGAETTHDLLNRYFKTVDGVVERYGGAVDKHIGDNVMAIFGAPFAHADDPERAVRSALDIHTAMRELSQDLGRDLTAHIGIASGQVVASGTGSETHQEYTVTGDTVNLASRLQDLAKGGETLVSETVHRLSSAQLDYTALSEIKVKGFAHSIPVWRVVGLRADGGAASLGPFVGRRSERRQFTGFLEECLQTGGGQAVLVRGDAGIGKSRLVTEFADIARERGFAVHKGLVLDFGVGKGRDAIRTLVRSLLGAPPGSAKSARSKAAKHAVSIGDIHGEQLVFLNDLLDLTQPVELRSIYDAMDNETRHAGLRQVVGDLINRLSERVPVLLVIEDIHWADGPALAQFASITQRVSDCRALLVMTSRFDEDPLDRPWRAMTGSAPLTTIDLGPLKEVEAVELAQGLFEGQSHYIESCIARAEGNPFFLEQLLRDADEGIGEAVPPSIKSSVLARIDRLPSEDKKALQAASIIGQRFDLETLRYLVGDAAFDCAGLVDHFLVRPEGDGYLFAHALLRDGVYDSLLKARARDFHLKASEWFADTDLALRAQHLDCAADSQAPRAYGEATQAEISNYRFERAQDLVKHGLSISGDEDRSALLTLLGEVLHALGLTHQSIKTYREALTAAKSDTERCQALLGVANGMRVTGLYEEALEEVEKAELVAATQDEIGHVHYLRGNLCFPLARGEECLRSHEKALACANSIGSVELKARALSGLGDAYYALGRMLTAKEYFSQCLALCKQHGFGRLEVTNYSMIADVRFYLNDLPGSLEDCLVGAEAAASVGNHRSEILCRQSACSALINMAETERALEQVGIAEKLTDQIGATIFVPDNLHHRAMILEIEGRHREAHRTLERALEITEELGGEYVGPVILGRLAILSDGEKAKREYLALGENILQKGALSYCFFDFYRNGIEASLQLRDWKEAERYAAALEDYTEAEPLPWTDFWISRGRALAAFGRGSPDGAIIDELKRLREEADHQSLRWGLPAIEEALAAI